MPDAQTKFALFVSVCFFDKVGVRLAHNEFVSDKIGLGFEFGQLAISVKIHGIFNSSVLFRVQVFIIVSVPQRPEAFDTATFGADMEALRIVLDLFRAEFI